MRDRARSTKYRTNGLPGTRYWQLLLLCIVLLGGLARFWNLDWDHGAYTLHPDEWALNQVVRRLGPDLNPHFFFYGSFPIYLYHGTAKLLMWLTGANWLDPSLVSLIGRFYSALAGTLILPLLFLVGRRLWGTTAGLLAAALSASAPLLIQAAHFGTVDSMVTLTGVTILWLSLRIADEGGGRGDERRKTKDEGRRTGDKGTEGVTAASGRKVWFASSQWGTLVATALVLGLAVATKLTAASFLLMPTIALFVPGRNTVAKTSYSQIVRRYLLFLAICATVTLAASPYYVLAGSELWAAIQEQTQELNGGYKLAYTWQFIGTTPYLFEGSNLIFWGVGLATGLTALVGWAWSVTSIASRGGPLVPLLLLTLWPTLYFLYIGTWEARFVRHTLPLVPFLCLFAAGALTALLHFATERSQPDDNEHKASRHAPLATHHLLRRVLSRMLVGLVAAFSGLWGLAFLCIYTSTDTRLMATAWFHADVPLTARIVIEDKDTLVPLPDVSHSMQSYQIEVIKPTVPDSPAKLTSISSTLSNGDLLVISSRRWSATIPRLPNFPITGRYYRQLFAGKLGYSPIAAFASYPRLGPLVFTDDSAEETFQVFDHPTVLVFRNTARLSADEIKSLIEK